MILLHNIGPVKHNSNYNTAEEIVETADRLSFDGIYRNVWENRHILEDRDVLLFVTGAYVGKNNYFDVGMPIEMFADWNEIMDLVYSGAKLGWHTWTHKDLTTLDDYELEKEVTPPFPMESFAYPHGKFNGRVIEAVKKAGFKEAWSVTEGDGSQYQKLRRYL